MTCGGLDTYGSCSKYIPLGIESREAVGLRHSCRKTSLFQLTCRRLDDYGSSSDVQARENFLGFQRIPQGRKEFVNSERGKGAKGREVEEGRGCRLITKQERSERSERSSRALQCLRRRRLFFFLLIDSYASLKHLAWFGGATGREDASPQLSDH